MTNPTATWDDAETNQESLVSASERAKLEAVEECRSEIRQRLEKRRSKDAEKSQFWKEKLIAPAVIVLLTVFLSGLGIPIVLESIDETRRVKQVTSELLQEVAQQTAGMQDAINARADAIDSYWADVSRTNAVLGEFGLKRDLGQMKEEEYARQDDLIENDRRRISESLDKSYERYAQELRTFRPWLHRTRMRINYTYQHSTSRSDAEKALASIGAELDTVDAWLTKKHDGYQERLYRDISAVKSDRLKFKAKELTVAEYSARANAILDRLRNPVPTDAKSYILDSNSIARILEFVANNDPSM